MDVISVIDELTALKDYLPPSAYYPIDDAIELILNQGIIVNKWCDEQMKEEENGEENIL